MGLRQYAYSTIRNAVSLDMGIKRNLDSFRLAPERKAKGSQADGFERAEVVCCFKVDVNRGRYCYVWVDLGAIDIASTTSVAELDIFRI